jgi:hypothetical protein
MDNFGNVAGAEADAADDGAKQRRERSQIEFPYTDLGQAEELAGKLMERGGGAAEPAQLAAWMDQSAGGGTFRSRLSAARMFGFITSDRDAVRITDDGRDVLDPDKAPAVRSRAFLRVPLFEAMFQKNSGYPLPPAAAIERQMLELGVPTKQKERARQVFIKSANVAQFIDASSGRLSKPAVSAPAQEDLGPPPPPPDDKRHGGGGGGGNYHPFVQGLLNELPATEDFPNWTVEEQAEWLRTAAGIFKLMSKQAGRITVEIEKQSPSQGAGASRVTGGLDNPSETA